MSGRLPGPPADFSFEALGEGRFAIGGTFGFPTVAAILERSKQLFDGVPVIRVDLSGVKHGDSAGLALLLEWINWATHYGHEIRYCAIPQQILAIARISEVEDLLSAGERVHSPAGGAAAAS
jgi:phospholipid transport system transporter-binding protein